MADRYLEVEITKLVGTTLYLKVDDEDFDALKQEGVENLDKLKIAIRLMSQVVKSGQIAAAVKETVDSSEWEEPWNPTDSDYEVHSVREVPKEEAELYAVFDVKTKKIADE